MTVLCLDLGSKTGWALSRPLHTSGTWKHKPGRYDGGGMRYLLFRRWLGQMATASGPLEAVYFEEVRNHKGVDAAHVYGGLLGHLTAWCEEQVPPVPYLGVPVGTIKKHATGKGTAGKPEMIARAGVITQRVITDDNEADALCLLDYVLSTLHKKKGRVRV